MNALVLGWRNRTFEYRYGFIQHVPSRAVVTRFGGIFVIYQVRLVWSTVSRRNYKALIFLRPGENVARWLRTTFDLTGPKSTCSVASGCKLLQPYRGIYETKFGSKRTRFGGPRGEHDRDVLEQCSRLGERLGV